MDYPSASEDDDSDFVEEEHDETQENDSHVIDSDMVLSSSDSDESSLSGNVQEDRGRYCYRLQRFHKDAFYSAYLPERLSLCCGQLVRRRSQLGFSSIVLLTLYVGTLRVVAYTVTGMAN